MFKCAVSLTFLFILVPAITAQDKDRKEPDPKKVAAKIKEVAGSAEFLRSVPKHFAALEGIDSAKNQVTLLIEGQKEAKVWPLAPDAEIKVSGWWGRLDDLPLKGRVWVWLKLDRKKQPTAISMISDEISQQFINGPGLKFEKFEEDKITFLTVQGKPRTLEAAVRKDLKKGDLVFVQSAGGRVTALLNPKEFEQKQKDQKERQRVRWGKEGLPGSAAFIHVFSGEMDLILDHEAMRWARSLQKGDAVTLAADPPMKAVVKSVQPWRERTQIRLVVKTHDLAGLTMGQRLFLLRTPPAVEVDTALLPPDIDRPRAREDRVDWFMANIYCTCKVSGDGCTGHFYTLASCNPNACGMPLFMRKILKDMIEEEKTDRQIFEELVERFGPTLTRPHLLP